MPLLDSRVKVRHPCAYCEFSGAFPEVQFVLRCNGETDALRVVAPDFDTLERVTRSDRSSTQQGLPTITEEGRT